MTSVPIFGPFRWMPDEKIWSHGKLTFKANNASVAELALIDKGLRATTIDDVKDSLRVRVVCEGDWEWLEFFFGMWRRCLGVAKVHNEIGVYEVQTVPQHVAVASNCLVRLLRTALSLDSVPSTPMSEECRNAIAELEAKYGIDLVTAQDCELFQVKCELLEARVAGLEAVLGKIAETATTARSTC